MEIYINDVLLERGKDCIVNEETRSVIFTKLVGELEKTINLLEPIRAKYIVEDGVPPENIFKLEGFKQTLDEARKVLDATKATTIETSELIGNESWCYWHSSVFDCQAHLHEARYFKCPYANPDERLKAEFPCSDYKAQTTNKTVATEQPESLPQGSE